MRDFIEIKEFTLSVLDQWTNKIEGARYVRNLIKEEKQLTSEDAEILIEILGIEARKQMEKVVKNESNYFVVLETDSLSIYSDVWAQYCREDNLQRRRHIV